jgi:hypothetical protein
MDQDARVVQQISAMKSNICDEIIHRFLGWLRDRPLSRIGMVILARVATEGHPDKVSQDER